MFAASRAPSAAPAPTTVCTSSMKSITSPFFLFNSSRRRFSLSSKSPLKRVPATSLPMTFLKNRGTFPSTILWASPSTTAVFPTPGSPMRTGLFFVLLDSICITLLISFSRSTTGMSFFSRASCVRSTVKRASASTFSASSVLPVDLIFLIAS